MTRKHRNVPVFIPHLGCPNQCVFCNQRLISGCMDFREETVRTILDEALSDEVNGEQTEIAFFGGSFTGINRGLMVRLLNLAEGYIQSGRVASIRLSTRPDYISEDILEILSAYSVRNIELGLQSMDDAVLMASGRGHTAMQAVQACRMVTQAGFLLTGQMMIGLPASTLASELETARQICSLGATAVRIYPTVVFYDTPLCKMAQSGTYIPLSVEEAVERSAAVLEVFRRAHIPCIRIGLCATESLTDSTMVYAGPNHPALGELVLNACAYRELSEAVHNAGAEGAAVTLALPKRAISQMVGQHRCNLKRLYAECGTRVLHVVGVEDDAPIRIIFDPHFNP